MVYSKLFISIFITIFSILLLLTTVVYAEGIQSISPSNQLSSSSGYNFKNQSDLLPFVDTRINVESESFYDIKLISPEFLTQLIANADQGDEILKAGPGMVIGLYTPRVLYMRSDITNDEFLTESREKSNVKDEITQHLIDISFGKDNSNLSILKDDLKYQFWFDSSYTQDDIHNALEFAKIFNNLSSTTQFEDESVMRGDLKDNYEKIPYHYYNIRIVPMKYLNEYKDDKYKSSAEEIVKDKNGKMIGFLTAEYLYLWDGLNPAEREYYVTKSLFWSCGLHGETSTRTDSYFYKNLNTSANLSYLDKEAIILLYGGRLSNDMKPDRIRKALDISK
ncbi:MAG: hypothetical protein CVV33_00580 [Methanomicrobiales archaeon HGW-Methanomicrobiales-4]|nr:MAG: hypothetical protein CVV33_00580 [Methanomicrobiales archaeon HGW-Methanomicrobiales-4]